MTIWVIYLGIRNTIKSCVGTHERETAYHTQNNDYKPESSFLKCLVYV